MHSMQIQNERWATRGRTFKLTCIAETNEPQRSATKAPRHCWELLLFPVR
jgi:hypothetical protein